MDLIDLSFNPNYRIFRFSNMSPWVDSHHRLVPFNPPTERFTITRQVLLAWTDEEHSGFLTLPPP
jgi:hypothetical protein